MNAHKESLHFENQNELSTPLQHIRRSPPFTPLIRNPMKLPKVHLKRVALLPPLNAVLEVPSEGDVLDGVGLEGLEGSRH